jgi:hypothetical protein
MRSINIYWKTLLHLLLNERKPHRHLLLPALEDPIGIASYQLKYHHPLSQLNQFLNSFNLFHLIEQTNVHFRASPPMAGDNHHVPLVELALLSSTLAKALAGPGYDDYSRTETLQWMARLMGPDTLCADYGHRRWHARQRWAYILSESIKPRFLCHCRHQKLACSG